MTKSIRFQQRSRVITGIKGLLILLLYRVEPFGSIQPDRRLNACQRRYGHVQHRNHHEQHHEQAHDEPWCQQLIALQDSSIRGHRFARSGAAGWPSWLAEDVDEVEVGVTIFLVVLSPLVYGIPSCVYDEVLREGGRDTLEVRRQPRLCVL